jgi:hypothetical protein
MTDEQIIKGLECCADESVEICNECPYFVDTFTCNQMQMRKDALDLINRQKAEIEALDFLIKESNKLVERQDKTIDRLKTLAELGNMRANDYRVMRDRALKAESEVKTLREEKAEAIKEFWSRLQGIAYRSEVEWSYGEHPMLIELDDVEEIYKEMAGDTE